MAEDSELTPVKGISRRAFLKMSGGAAAAAVIDNNPLVSILPQPGTAKPRAKEEEGAKEWTREEVFEKPVKFLDDYFDSMVNKIGIEKLSIEQKELLDYFSVKYTSMKERIPSIEFTRHNLEVGYKIYGKKIHGILEKAERWEDVVDHSFLSTWMSAVVPFWRPLQTMYENLKDPDRRQFQTLQVDTSDLLTVANSRFHIVAGEKTKTYKEQKAMYRDMSDAIIESSSLDENIKANWDMLIRNSKLSKMEGEHVHTKEEFETFKKWVYLHRNLIPLAFLNIWDIDIGNVRRGGISSGVIDARGGFFTMINLKSDYDKEGKKERPDQNLMTSYSADAQAFADDASIVLIHELGHRVDLNNGAMDFFYFHTGDLIDYAESISNMFETFFQFIDGDPRKGIKPAVRELEQLFYDPIAARMIGTDEIRSANDLARFEGELDTLMEIFPLINENSKLEKFIKSSGMDWFFKNKGKNLVNWDLRIKEIAHGNLSYLFNVFLANHQKGPSVQSLDTDSRLSSFSGITPQHLKEMKQMVRDLFVSRDNPGINQFAIHTLLEMKSLYLLVSYSFLRQAIKAGVVKPDVTFLKLQGLVIWQLMHWMTGPINQYLPLASNVPQTLHVPMNKLTESSIKEANRQRKQMSGFFNPRTSSFLDGLSRHSLNIQNKKAKMWGADITSGVTEGNESEVYSRLAELVTDEILKLPHFDWEQLLPNESNKNQTGGKANG